MSSEVEVEPDAFHTPWDRLDKKKLIACGALSFMAEDIFYYPMETLKTRQQADHNANFHHFKDLKHRITNIFKHEKGVLSLYRGFGLSLSAGIPSQAAYYYSYIWSRDRLLKSNLSAPFVYMVSGAFANMVQYAIYLPADMFTTRMQMGVKAFPCTGGRLATFRRVYMEEGGMRGLYRGYGVTIMHMAPATAIYWMCQETYKRAIHKYLNFDEHGSGVDYLPMWQVHLSAGSLAGVTSTCLTNPLDVVRTRILVTEESGEAAEARRQGKMGSRFRVIQNFKQIFAEEGFRGFWKGLVPRLAMVTLLSGWSSVLYEQILEISEIESMDIE